MFSSTLHMPGDNFIMTEAIAQCGLEVSRFDLMWCFTSFPGCIFLAPRRFEVALDLGTRQSF